MTDPDWLIDALGSLRSDDPDIPADVSRRLDSLLTTLRNERTPVGDPQSSATVDDAPNQSGAITPASEAATVIPIRARRTGHRVLLGAVAASAAVLLGGLTILSVNRAGNGQTAIDAARETNGTGQQLAAAPPVAYVASGHSYTPASLTADTAALIRAAAPKSVFVRSPAPAQSQASGTPLDTATFGAASLRPTAGCLAEVTGSADVSPIVVDEAEFATTPAFIIVVASPTSAAAGSVDVWVVRRTCSAADAGLLTFARVTP